MGRGDAPERIKKHAVDPSKQGLKPVIVYENNLTKAQAKHIEQQLIATYGGKNPPPPDSNKQLINKINSYSDENKNKSTYDSAHAGRVRQGQERHERQRPVDEPQ